MSLAASPNEVFTLTSPESSRSSKKVSRSRTSKLSAEQPGTPDADLVITAFANPVAEPAFESNPLVRRVPAINHGAYLIPDRQTLRHQRAAVQNSTQRVWLQVAQVHRAS